MNDVVYADGVVCVSILVSGPETLATTVDLTMHSTPPEMISTDTRTPASDGCLCTLSNQL